ncbi:MAG: DUF4112 domain-containing protein [Gammaproteobacteria bacterium]|nr:DUF4112 domain-containing protein [Gammaproteobacteria bacterium]MBT8150605.1 DUF4112 domain-containing protein [Gammaproteobacteria bacterium]NND38405.1 DUF4112 domain-containing protein [Pseudomonadales bacterium]
MDRQEKNSEIDTRKRLEYLAWLLDSSIRLPGGFRIGFDGILGLLPGIGDTLSAGLSSYIVVEAVRLNVPGLVLLRMLLNIALELFVGIVPIVGDLFDFGFKANERNIRLINAHLEAPARTRRQSRRAVLMVALGLFGLLVFTMATFIALLQLL